MTLADKAIAHFQARPNTSPAAVAKKYGISSSYAYKLKERALSRPAPEPDVPQQTALDMQVDGEHYKKFKIQPIEFIHANNLPFIEGNIVKYITRWREKNGVRDLEKVKHYVDLLIELENKS